MYVCNLPNFSFCIDVYVCAFIYVCAFCESFKANLLSNRVFGYQCVNNVLFVHGDVYMVCCLELRSGICCPICVRETFQQKVFDHVMPPYTSNVSYCVSSCSTPVEMRRFCVLTASVFPVM